MKNVLAVALLCLLSLSLAAGQKASKSSVEDQIKKHEQDWAQAVVKEGVGFKRQVSLHRYMGQAEWQVAGGCIAVHQGTGGWAE